MEKDAWLFAILGLILFFLVLGCLYMVWQKYCGAYEKMAQEKQWKYRVRRISIKKEKKKTRYADPDAPPAAQQAVKESSIYSCLDNDNSFEIDWE